MVQHDSLTPEGASHGIPRPRHQSIDSGDTTQVQQGAEEVFTKNGVLGEEKFEDVVVDRHTSIGGVMGWCGDLLGKSWMNTVWKDVPATPGPQDTPAATEGEVVPTTYPRQSKAMAAGKKLHGFMSYRWQTGRLRLSLALIGHFGLPLLVMYFYLFVPFLYILLNIFFENPCEWHLQLLETVDGMRYDHFAALMGFSDCKDFEYWGRITEKHVSIIMYN